MRRPVSLGTWPSSLLLIWLTFTTTFTLYIPFELAKIPQESLVQLPVSNAAAHYPQFVHRLLPYFARPNNDTRPLAPRSILSVTTPHDDAVSRPVFDRQFDEPVVVEPAIAAEIDSGARPTDTGSTHSTFTGSVPSFVVSGAKPLLEKSQLVPSPGRAVDSAWYATVLQGISASLRGIYDSVASTFVFPGKASRQRIAPPCACDLSSPSHTYSSEQPHLHGMGKRIQTGRLSNITASLHAFWKYGQRLLGHRNVEGSPLGAGQSVAKQDPSCDCARLKSPDATMDQARLAQKDIFSAQFDGTRSATGDFVDDFELPRRPIRSATGDFVDDSELPRPIPRTHDCNIDDPNWQLSFSAAGILQHRHCRPTYMEWWPQDYLLPTLDITRAGPNDRAYFSSGSGTTISKSASHSIHSEAIEQEAGLIYGLPRSDPRNRNVNLDPHFVPCLKHSPQTLIIVGSYTERLCLPNTSLRFKTFFHIPVTHSLSSDTLIRKASQTAGPTPRVEALLGHTAEETRSLRPDHLAHGAQTTIALSSHIPTESKTATTSIDELPPLSLEVAQGKACMSISCFRDRFGDTLSTVLLLAAAILYLAVQSILAPLYTPFMINALRYTPAIAKRFLGIGSGMDEGAKGSIKRRSSSSRRAAYRISRRMSSRATRRTHPLFVASSCSNEELQMMMVRTPPARSRRSVFGLFPGQLPPGTRSPAQLRSSNSTPAQSQGFVPETLSASRSALPRDPSNSESRRSQSPSSVGRSPSRGRPLGPKQINVRPSSPDVYQSYNKLDKGKAVDRSGFQSNLVTLVPVNAPTLHVYTYLEPQVMVDPPSVLQPCSSVNLSSSGPIHASASDRSDKENVGASRLPPPTPIPDGMQVDDEGWPVKPITQVRQRLARVDKSGCQTNLVTLVPVNAPTVHVYTYPEPQAIADPPSALQPSSSVNLPSSGSIHGSAPDWSDKENLSPSRLPPPAPIPDGMQVDDEGWPVKPITRVRQRLARISEEASSSRLSPATPTPANWNRLNDEGRSEKPITRTPKTFAEFLAEVSVSLSPTSEPSTSSPQPAEVFYDENSERTPRAAAPKESPATQRNRRALGDLSRLAVGTPEARASPPAAPKPYIPKPFYNPRSIPGVKTFVPYYDNESDEDRHAQDSLKRQARDIRRAEHIEERATLPRHPRTGRVIRPGQVDTLPSGARLAPLR